MKRAKHSTKSVPKEQGPETIVPPDIQLPDARPERRWLWFIGLLVGIGMLAGSTAIALQRTIPGWEERIFRFINNWPDALREVFLVGTIAPESLWIAVAAVLVTFFVKLYRLSWQLAAATFAGYIMAYAGKELVARGRPIEFFRDAHIRVGEIGMGFPSGHTMIITVVVLTLFPYLPRGWRWLILLFIPVMALSRIYLGVHAPLDVVGGFAVGLVVVSAMRCMPSKLRELFRFD